MFHFLHIRKTGGTAIKQALRELAEGNAMVRLHPHKTRLRDIPEGEKVFFFLRDPLTRFVSGFNSRLRQGQPRYDSPWDEKEKIAFGHFSTANDLAEALFAGPLQKQAEQAMTDIRHINQPYAYWLESIAYVSSRISDLVYVGFQETLAADFERLKEILGLPPHCILPTDAVQAHKTPEGYDTFLSDRAVTNLKRWYAEDFNYIDFFKKFRAQQLKSNGSGDMKTRHSPQPSHPEPGRPGLRPHSGLRLHRDTDKILELTQYWSPPVPPWKPLKKAPNSSLRMACLVEERLYQGLRFEGTVLLLTPANWRHVLKYGKPDFLLIESIWISATGHWHMGQCPASPHREEMLEILSLAGKLGIPTVFWITKGHEYHAHYKDLARRFDFVFCADPQEVDLLHDEGIAADLLAPCVQPAIYNPFRHYDHYDAMRLGILYDGWADLDRMTDQLRILKEIKPYGLNIIESRYQIFRNRMNALPDYKECIQGCVTPQARIISLKYSDACVTFHQTLSTRTTQQWMTLEAVGSHLPVVHFGPGLSSDDVRKGLVREFSEKIDFLMELVRFREDDLYRERAAHLMWRETFMESTFAHRVRKICERIGVHHDWVEYPKASLIMPTFRGDMIPECVEKFERQTYPNKELIIVFNGSDLPSIEGFGRTKQHGDIRAVNVPAEMFAGACLNQGCLMAQGEYCLRMDDDDHYQPNYLLDMILQAKCVDADLFGKPPSPVVFADDPAVYARSSVFPLSIASDVLVRVGRQWLGGNSISGKTSFLKDHVYNDHCYGAADTNLLYNIKNPSRFTFAIMDAFNLIAERRKDLDSHTWKLNKDQIIKHRYRLPDIQELTI